VVEFGLKGTSRTSRGSRNSGIWASMDEEGTGKNAEDGAIDQEQRVAVEREHKECGDASDDGRSVV